MRASPRCVQQDNREYRELTEDFVNWCQQNHFQINTPKTKEQVVDSTYTSEHPENGH